jgi:hypothetical protein
MSGQDKLGDAIKSTVALDDNEVVGVHQKGVCQARAHPDQTLGAVLAGELVCPSSWCPARARGCELRRAFPSAAAAPSIFCTSPPSAFCFVGYDRRAVIKRRDTHCLLAPSRPSTTAYHDQILLSIYQPSHSPPACRVVPLSPRSLRTPGLRNTPPGIYQTSPSSQSQRLSTHSHPAPSQPSCEPLPQRVRILHHPRQVDPPAVSPTPPQL